jgi:hypothetical protein
MTTKKKPAFEAFTVRDGGKGKSYFTKVGAAWPTKNGGGVTLYLDALPVDGKLILMPPKAKQEAAPDAAGNDDGPYIDDAGNFTNPA